MGDSDGSLDERKMLVYTAKLAEQAERYDGRVRRTQPRS